MMAPPQGVTLSQDATGGAPPALPDPPLVFEPLAPVEVPLVPCVPPPPGVSTVVLHACTEAIDPSVTAIVSATDWTFIERALPRMVSRPPG